MLAFLKNAWPLAIILFFSVTLPLICDDSILVDADIWMLEDCDSILSGFASVKQKKIEFRFFSLID